MILLTKGSSTYNCDICQTQNALYALTVGETRTRFCEECLVAQVARDERLRAALLIQAALPRA